MIIELAKLYDGKITFSVMSCDFYRPFLNWLFFTAAQLAARLREYQMLQRISTGTKEKELSGLMDINKCSPPKLLRDAQNRQKRIGLTK